MDNYSIALHASTPTSNFSCHSNSNVTKKHILVFKEINIVILGIIMHNLSKKNKISFKLEISTAASPSLDTQILFHHINNIYNSIKAHSKEPQQINK